MKITSLLENQEFEKRISITPEVAKKYISLGLDVNLPKNFGNHLGIDQKEFLDVGVNFIDDNKKLIEQSDIFLQLDLPIKENIDLVDEKKYLLGHLIHIATLNILMK